MWWKIEAEVTHKKPEVKWNRENKTIDEKRIIDVKQMKKKI
jgi:hypothetical protein